MKNTRKNALKVVIMLALFCPAVFADGDMGGGGLAASNNEAQTAKTVILAPPADGDGDMGGGGRSSDSSFLDSVLASISNYFDWTP